MPFLKFSRDKRGVEHFALVHTTTNRRGKVRPRVLYWFRSPPDVKMGREPFDPAIRRALETQNPDIVFDWRAIVDTPIPSADVDKWRERRRAERAAKHAHAEPVEAAIQETDADADADADDGEAPASLDRADAATPGPGTAQDELPDADAPSASSDPAIVARPNALNAQPSAPSPQPWDPNLPQPSTGREGDRNRKPRRRRRSGGGGRGGAAQVDAPSSADPSGDDSSGE